MKKYLFWITLLVAGSGTVLVTAMVWIFLLNPLQQAVKTGNEIQALFVKYLNATPQIEVNNTVVFAQNTPTLELVTVERSSLVRHLSEETWLHSTKAFEIEAPFTVRAGFRLRDAFTVNILRGGRIAEIRLPRPKILSMEMGDLRILRDDDGLWNKLTGGDREMALRALSKTAKEEFLKTDILKAATGEAEKRIRNIVREAGCEPVFVAESSPEMD